MGGSESLESPLSVNLAGVAAAGAGAGRGGMVVILVPFFLIASCLPRQRRRSSPN